MSTAYYTKLWLQARKDLEKVLQTDSVILQAKPTEDMAKAASQCLDLYYRYRAVLNRIIECHNQLVQPQLRSMIGKILDMTITRMLEIRQEVVNLTLSECSWPIDTLLKMKLTPDDVTLNAPTYDLGGKLEERERRQKLIKEVMSRLPEEILTMISLSEIQSSLSTMTIPDTISMRTTTTMKTHATQKTGKSFKIDPDEEEIPEDETEEQKEARVARVAERKKWREAMTLIQSHERARAARVLCIDAEKRLKMMQALIAGEYNPRVVPEPVQIQAATVIQRAWRQHRDRRLGIEKMWKTDEALGMLQFSYQDRRVFDRNKELSAVTLLQQAKAVVELKKKYAEQKERLLTHRGPTMLANIKQEIRDWMMEWFTEIGYFDCIPDAKYGGTALVVTGQVRQIEEFGIPVAVERKKEAVKDDEFSGVEDEVVTWNMPESQVFDDLIKANKEYVSDWLVHTEKFMDPENPLIVNALIEDICYNMQLNTRVEADDEMRAEYSILNDALAKDLAGEGGYTPVDCQNFEELVAAQESDKKKKKAKSRRNSKRDSADEEPEDDLITELASAGIFRDLPQEELDDWPGATALAFTPYYQMRLGDVKQPIIDYCVLPIASKFVNSRKPFIRSVCICGPPRSGPVFLARAVCNELNATVFDLTPQRLIGHFTVRPQQMRLAALVSKLARKYAPSVILVENEMAWLKFVPQHLRSVKAGRFQGVYSKIIKDIKPGDQVLFLTASTEPYSTVGNFLKSFDRVVVVPTAEYGSLARAYRIRLDKQHHVERYFDVSCLARLMAGLPIDAAHDLLDENLGISRRMRFASKPLTQHEILETYLERNEAIQKSVKAAEKFRYRRIPIERKRKAEEDERRFQEQLAAAEAKKKNKK